MENFIFKILAAPVDKSILSTTASYPTDLDLTSLLDVLCF